MLLTPILVGAQDEVAPCDGPDIYVIHLKNGSEVEATNVRTDSSYHRATVRMRGGSIELTYAPGDVERIVKTDLGAGGLPSDTRSGAKILAGLGLGMLGVMLGGAGGELTGLPAFAVGTAYGVYAVGDTDHETGSFGATLAASVVSTGVGYALLLGPFTNGYGLAMMLLGPPVSATLAFNATRRSRCPDAQDAAAMFDVGRSSRSFAFGAPRVSSRVSPIDGRVMQTVDVLRVRF